MGRQPVLRGRGRAVHQRQRRLDRLVLRRGHDAARRAAPRRAARRTAAGTARSRTARRCRRSGRRSTSSRACSSTSGRSAARPTVAEARRRGEAYMLERRLFRRKSTGEVIDPSWLQLLVPDLVALRRPARPRLPPRRRASRPTSGSPRRSGSSRASGTPTAAGRSRTSTRATSQFEMDDGEGTPSRWITLRALRVLDWAGVAAHA